jgi:hypothetical protein
MRTRWIVVALLAYFCVRARAEAPAAKESARQTAVALQQNFFSRLDVGGSGAEAEALLRHDPSNAAALFVRMETAELQERTDRVLDSALRLCRANAAADIQKIASSRVLEHAANSSVFNSMLRQIRTAALRNGVCAFNLRLALVAAAADGAPNLDLDETAKLAGLLTRWSISGPFGRFSNLDFERPWPPEAALTPGSDYRSLVAELFWFRDGTIKLPDYFAAPGVFYAAADVEISNDSALRLEVFAAGPYKVFVDGRPLLLRNPPYVSFAGLSSVPLHLAPGKRRILLKFTTDSVPLRVALRAETAAPRLSTVSAAIRPLENYTRALLDYLRGDFAGMARVLDSGAYRHGAASLYLHALLQSAMEQHSSRTAAAWEALAEAQPSALLARTSALEAATASGRAENAAVQASEAAGRQAASLARRNPQSETAVHLAFGLLRAKPIEAENLLARLLELRPSCAHLSAALKFYNSEGELNNAQRAEQQLAGCAPGALDYARALSDSGRHAAAASILQQLIAANPLDRAARRLLVEELLLDNQQGAAQQEARELHQIAPNSAEFGRLADDPALALDTSSPRAEGFAGRDEFYVPDRRDGLKIARAPIRREFARGSAVILLSDKAIQFQRDGSISVYVHQVTRLLNKDGIGAYGEVTLPPGAEVLELRTIKVSGQTAEPELAVETSTISMPALEPGDSIEEEFVSRYPRWDQWPESATSFEFGSFAAPVLSSRLIVLTAPGLDILISEKNGAPAPRTEKSNGRVVRIWARENIPQTATESFLPRDGLLPTITVAGPGLTLDALHDQLISSTRIGPRAAIAALGIHLPAAGTESEKAKLLYSFVTRKIESSGSDWTANTADDTLLNSRGSRTLALLALARASGLKAGLVLAHPISYECQPHSDFRCYTAPLVRLWPGGETVDVDAESDGLPFGAVPPGLESRSAVLVPLAPGKKPEIVALITKPLREKTLAEGELWLNSEGDLAARVHVRLGAVRAQEVRNRLRAIGACERQAFFEQLAGRIIPDGTDVVGLVLHENDPEQPLELTLHWVVPRFISLHTGVAEIDQLAPALGLRSTYVKAATRRFPLFTDSLLFESTVFRLHLPPGIEVRSLPAHFSTRTEFGDYSARFAHAGQQIEIRREFRIPVQIIAPDRYPAFDAFARQIDDAERQRISLAAVKDAAGELAKSKFQRMTRD